MTDSRIPIAVIAPLIRRWLDVYKATRAEESGNGNRNTYVADGCTHDGYLVVLSFHCGVSARVLRRILNGNVECGGRKNRGVVDSLTFDMADKIVCATMGPLAWHTEESLMPYYGPLKVTAAELVNGYELPEGFDFDSLPQQKKYRWSNARMRLEAATNAEEGRWVPSRRGQKEMAA